MQGATTTNCATSTRPSTALSGIWTTTSLAAPPRALRACAGSAAARALGTGGATGSAKGVLTLTSSIWLPCRETAQPPTTANARLTRVWTHHRPPRLATMRRARGRCASELAAPGRLAGTRARWGSRAARTSLRSWCPSGTAPLLSQDKQFGPQPWAGGARSRT